ncbi:hypothetical protein ENUP19_0304G0018 [Entamoeba nuttalli]|uniref:Tetraspanin family protein n=2 Tax=Entamoeba nuttalli TaxID=412467 RepID=K2HY97_ENTNP|nr:hypothetical protein ENU1_058930 [Entamoeba nuttalli P19]EKE41345.1 hypothetical protein ENU1_058930 [Entamoeba nuttalli P19]|eukprot:XP_008856318.1 hypothetical protein ENU1_058930 [Entamoeba nuttalli P19]
MIPSRQQILKYINLTIIIIGIFLLFHGITNALFSRHPENELSSKSVTHISLITGIIVISYSIYCFKQYINYNKKEMYLLIISVGCLIIMYCILSIFTNSITTYSINSIIKKEQLIGVENEFNCCGWKEPRNYCSSKILPTCYHVLITPHNTYKTITSLITLLEIIHIVILLIGTCISYKPTKRKEDFYSMYTNIGEK